jgi:hypothetical protein
MRLISQKENILGITIFTRKTMNIELNMIAAAAHIISIAHDNIHHINAYIHCRASLKTHFYRDCCVGSVLESSCMPYTLRFSARCLFTFTKKLLFLEVPYSGRLNVKYFDRIPVSIPGPQ